MKRKLIVSISALSVLFCTMPICAVGEDYAIKTAYSDGYYIEFYVNDNSEAVITKISGENNSVKIPSVIAGYTVTGIAERTFYQQSQLETVTFPSTLKSIGDYAFSGCVSIKELALPESLNTLGEGSFMSCTSVNSIKIGENVNEIPDRCFYSCSGLESVDISDSITSIGFEAFFSCTSLLSLNISENVELIGENAIGKYYDIRNGGVSAVLGFSVIGKSGSYAEDYAFENDFNFISDGEVTYLLGDIDDDGKIDASDASAILTEYALLSTGEKSSFNSKQKLSADWNKDGRTDATDASEVLAEYARLSTGL